jgi:HEAT repeat protein
LPSSDVGQFLSLARSLGPVAIEWLMHLLASSEKRESRLALAATVSDLCRDTPERMTPWLSDSRWYVVRNVIHILGRIGGPRIVDLLRGASEHDEFRVRQEVVSAAAATGSEEARPLLLGMLNTMDTRLFCAALRQLSTRKDHELAGILVTQLQAPGFLERPTEERRAVYVAIAAAGGDETVPVLEAELSKGSWLTRRPDAHQRAIARCLLHLDTPKAREALAAGCRSRRPAVRKACEDALGGTEA